MGASLATLALDDSALASEAEKDDGTTGALSDTRKLKHPAIAILFHVGATGVVRVEKMNGKTRDIDAAKWGQGAWHLHKFRAVRQTGTTVAATAFEIGWGRS